MRNKELPPIGLYAYRRILSSERLCHALLWRIGRPQGIRCPRCHYSWICRMAEADRVEYRCRRCRCHFSETTGSIFAKTRTPLAKWLLAIGLFKIGNAARPLAGRSV